MTYVKGGSPKPVASGGQNEGLNPVPWDPTTGIFPLFHLEVTGGWTEDPAGPGLPRPSQGMTEADTTRCLTTFPGCALSVSIAGCLPLTRNIEQGPAEVRAGDPVPLNATLLSAELFSSAGDAPRPPPP